MKRKFTVLAVAASALALASCAYVPPAGQAYWQRLEDNSALYMTGPKAQQQLEEDIATCVRQVDELVELDALKKATPPDTHSEYHRALEASGDLDWYDTPTRYGDKKISHKDFQDFEGCMRFAGWERVRFVRYHVAKQARNNYSDVRNMRAQGLVPGVYSYANLQPMEEAKKVDDFSSLND